MVDLDLSKEWLTPEEIAEIEHQCSPTVEIPAPMTPVTTPTVPPPPL